ncbi:MAG: hypothetical protein PHN63_06400, partial [Candidatus Omnitrophica bacterium]|nr:hypothetical protein [Candidatus Omnitrophota bacterium]
TMTGLFTALPKEYISAYDKELMRKCAYVSESGFKWWGETLSQAIGKYPKIYLLTHPDTWVHANLAMAESYAKTLKEIQKLAGCYVSDFTKSTNHYLRRRKAK